MLGKWDERLWATGPKRPTGPLPFGRKRNFVFLGWVGKGFRAERRETSFWAAEIVFKIWFKVLYSKQMVLNISNPNFELDSK
jgi:hypothetical protein